jgi:hypothetical protein
MVDWPSSSATKAPRLIPVRVAGQLLAATERNSLLLLLKLPEQQVDQPSQNEDSTSTLVHD